MFCQKCGTEVTGAFCPNCGTAAGAAGTKEDQIIVHENAIVKPRYKVGHIALAGYLGFVFLFAGIILVIIALSVILGSGQPISYLFPFLLGGAFCVAISYLFYLPGLKSIRQNTPKEEIKSTTRSFFVRSLLFILGWYVAIIGCLTLIGLFLRAWRLGLAVSRPKDNEYTAFVNGKMISVFRIIDLEFSNHETTRYMYVDANGEYYRPSLR